MKNIEIFDPALCCSTGVCGPSPDQQLVAFSSMVKSLEGKAAVRRYNLAQEPTVFSQNAIVQKVLQDEGTAALPVVLVDGKLAMKGIYPSKEQLEQLLGLAAHAPCCESDPASEGCCEENQNATECCSPAARGASKCC